MIQRILTSRKFELQTYRMCQGVLSFTRKYGRQVLEETCKQALEYGKVTYTFVKNRIPVVAEDLRTSSGRTVTSNAAEFRRRGILPAGKETVLPGAGINLERYPYMPYPEHDSVHFLYLGRIMKEKGMDELFAAMRQLHKTCESKVILDLVGFYDDDVYKEQVSCLVADGIAVFHGFQTDPLPYYAAADCVVLPSYHEGMSNVLLEAAAAGRPVITSDIPGCREAVDNEKTGLLSQPKDPDSLYQQMTRMAALPLAERQNMGKAAHEKMTREFDKHRVVAATMAALFSTE